MMHGAYVKLIQICVHMKIKSEPIPVLNYASHHKDDTPIIFFSSAFSGQLQNRVTTMHSFQYSDIRLVLAALKNFDYILRTQI